MTKPQIGIPEIVIAAVLVVLAAVAIAFGTASDSGGNRSGAAAVAAEVGPIARNVERIRGLRFKRVPKPVVVTPEQTRADQLRDLDRTYPAADRRADTELLELLGLVPAGTDLRRLTGDVSSGQVVGYYDPHRKRLAVVNGPASSNRVIAVITLAHELNHALEDQRFGLHESTSAGADDGATAYTALLEGTATAVMDEYARRFIPPGAALGSLFSGLGAAAGSTAGIPPYVQRSLEFSYTGGERFVNHLRDVDGGWALVNRALRKRPPVSSEQVIHPEKYLEGERPLGVKVGALGLGAGWKRASRGTVGELDTKEILKLGNDDATASAAAAGWGGGRYELWTDAAAGKSCADPCRAADVLVLRWRWDTPRDAGEFDRALPLYLLRGLKATGAGPARWKVGDGGAAIAVRGSSTTLAFAPSPGQAARLAAR
jgi:hypothetical protein